MIILLFLIINLTISKKFVLLEMSQILKMIHFQLLLLIESNCQIPKFNVYSIILISSYNNLKTL